MIEQYHTSPPFRGSAVPKSRSTYNVFPLLDPSCTTSSKPGSGQVCFTALSTTKVISVAVQSVSAAPFNGWFQSRLRMTRLGVGGSLAAAFVLELKPDLDRQADDRGSSVSVVMIRAEDHTRLQVELSKRSLASPLKPASE